METPRLNTSPACSARWSGTESVSEGPRRSFWWAWRNELAQSGCSSQRIAVEAGDAVQDGGHVELQVRHVALQLLVGLVRAGAGRNS